MPDTLQNVNEIVALDERVNETLLEAFRDDRQAPGHNFSTVSRKHFRVRKYGRKPRLWERKPRADCWRGLGPIR